MTARTPPRPWTRKEQQEAARLFGLGLTHAEVGRELGRTERAVARFCYDAGLRRRRRYRRPEHYRERLAALVAGGLTVAEAAHALGLNADVAGRWARRWGVFSGPEARRLARRHQDWGRAGAAERAARRCGEALLLGWPGHPPRVARALAALYAAGPLTSAGLAARMGYRSRCVGWHLLSRLCAAGLAERCGRRGPWRLYRLAPGVAPCGSARERLEAEREGRLEREGVA
jgi:hypothetical protein